MDVRGAGVIVTGASRGLGAALAEELAAAGARVAMVARNEAELNAAAERIRTRGGVAFPFPADVGDKAAIHPLVGAAAAVVGPIELVVHNASTLGPVPLEVLLDTECEALERALAVNVVGPFRLTRAVVGGMVVRRRGLVVHVSSDAATSPYPRWGAYGASKAALDQLSRVWDAELDGTGVRVIAVDPGEMDTRMHADAVPDADRSTLQDPRQVARRLLGLIRQAQTLPPSARVEAAAFEVSR